VGVVSMRAMYVPSSSFSGDMVKSLEVSESVNRAVIVIGTPGGREREREKKDYKDIEKVGEGEEDGSREIKDKRLNEKTFKCINTSTF
jgi:hypothetical protein